MEEKFLESYKTLNSAQKQAVDAIEGPVLVVAGPGTGKTHILSLRVANILRQTDAAASNILCLTFTNKAATNMCERLYRLVGPSSRAVTVRTFHSFAADIMNQYPDYFWNGARLSVAPDAVQLEIIQDILASLPLDNPLTSTFAGAFTQLGDVKEALKLAKEAGLTPNQLQQVIEHNLSYIDKLEPELVKLLEAPLSNKKLAGLGEAIIGLPEQGSDLADLLLPLDTIVKESLRLAIEQDLPTGKTKQTGKWKTRWVQTVDGKKGMFNERKRNAWWLAVAEVYELYREQLHQRGYYDYSDMLIEVLEQLQNQPDMLADIQERFQYVLIDEFQDTNAAQLRMAHFVSNHHIANNRPNLMAVGDDDQSIFAFNGAELNNMLGFQRSYPDTKLIVLEENYRSSQAVLDAAKQVVEQAEDRLVKREPSISKNLSATITPPKAGDIRHDNYPTRQHQYTAVAGRIKEQWQNGEHDIAVLARKHDSLKQLASILLAAGIPVRYEQQSNVLEHPAVQQVVLIARTAASMAAGDRAGTDLGISQLLRHPMWGVPAKSLWKLATDNYSNPDWLQSLLEHADPKLQSIGIWLSDIARQSGQVPLTLTLENILGLAEKAGTNSPFRDYYLVQESTTSDYLETLSAIELLRGMTEEFSSATATLQDFVRFVELNLSTSRVIADESWFMSGERAVQLLTVYKAKGLEFDTVYVIDTIESMWRPRSGGRTSPANLQLQSYGEQYDDYIRLLYVAITRAKRNVFATSYFTDDAGNELLPTPLLAMLPANTIEAPTEEPITVLEDNLRWPRLSTSDEKALLHDRLERFALSPTALIDFVNVAEAGPGSFLERHLLYVPRGKSSVGSYGTAIHAALETAQRLVNTSQLELGTVLDRFESALAENPMVPLEYEQFRNRGASLLTKLFEEKLLTLQKGGLTEQRLSDIYIADARVRGTLDRIDETEDVICISDYKTGKALANFTTKDQTKMVKAWRHETQLLFYALLVRECGRFSHSKSLRTQMIYVEAEKASQITLGLDPSVEALTYLEKLIGAVWKHVMNLDFPDVSNYSQDRAGVAAFADDLVNGKI